MFKSGLFLPDIRVCSASSTFHCCFPANFFIFFACLASDVTGEIGWLPHLDSSLIWWRLGLKKLTYFIRKYPHISYVPLFSHAFFISAFVSHFSTFLSPS